MRALAGRIAVKCDEKEPEGSFLYALKRKSRKPLTTAPKTGIKEGGIHATITWAHSHRTEFEVVAEAMRRLPEEKWAGLQKMPR